MVDLWHIYATTSTACQAGFEVSDRLEYTVALCLYLDDGISDERARHELYHLLGCHEHFHMPRCYEQVAQLKHWRRAHQAEFFPAWDAITKRVLGSREAVNARLMSLNSRVANSNPDELRSSMPRDSATAR